MALCAIAAVDIARHIAGTNRAVDINRPTISLPPGRDAPPAPGVYSRGSVHSLWFARLCIAVPRELIHGIDARHGRSRGLTSFGLGRTAVPFQDQTPEGRTPMQSAPPLVVMTTSAPSSEASC